MNIHEANKMMMMVISDIIGTGRRHYDYLSYVTVDFWSYLMFLTIDLELSTQTDFVEFHP